MIEFAEPEFNVESLTASLHEGAARRRLEPQADSSAAALDSSNLLSHTPMPNAHTSPAKPSTQTRADEGHTLTLQPPFQPHSDDIYHVKDLLQYHDRNFVQNAYRAILKRGPDATGFKAFIESLRSGRLNKIDILARLRYSSEGRAKQVQVKGLLVPAAIRQSYRLPVIGYLLHLSVALLRLPNMVRGQQQFEAHTLAQHEQFAEHLNRMSATLSQLSQQTQQQLDLLLREQRAINAAQQQSQHEMLARLAALTQHFDTRLDESNQHFDTRLNKETAASQHRMQLLETQLADESSHRKDELEMVAQSLRSEASQALAQSIAEAMEKQQQIRTELILQGQRVTRLLDEAAANLNVSPDLNISPDQSQKLAAMAEEVEHNLDAFYVSFEDQFRGSRAEIKERLGVYLPLLSEAAIGSTEMPILDLGSGRGEWLELLQESGMKASGVDHNRLLIAQCAENNLEVVEGDLMDYLRRVPDASLGAVTGFHIIEHLPIELLVRMLDEALRVLKPGGAVIFETPNPQNVLVGSCNFYFDPTHRNPLPSPIMRFLLESRGFTRVNVINLNPSDTERVAGDSDLVQRFNQYFYGPMDYAVTGYKTSLDNGP